VQKVANEGKETESKVRHFCLRGDIGKDSGSSMPPAIKGYDASNSHTALHAPLTTVVAVDPLEYSETLND
jgi:hypothetical protein